MDLSGQWIDQAHQHRKLTKLILDMDSSVSETYGHQEGTYVILQLAGVAVPRPLFVRIPERISQLRLACASR